MRERDLGHFLAGVGGGWQLANEAWLSCATGRPSGCATDFMTAGTAERSAFGKFGVVALIVAHGEPSAFGNFVSGSESASRSRCVVENARSAQKSGGASFLHHFISHRGYKIKT